MIFAVVAVGLASGALKSQWTDATVTPYTRMFHYASSLWGKQYVILLLHSSSSPVFSLLIIIHLTGSPIGTWVTHTGVQSRLTVLTLGQERR